MSVLMLLLVSTDEKQRPKETKVFAHKKTEVRDASIHISQSYISESDYISLTPAEAKLMAKGLINAAKRAEGVAA